MAGLIPGDVFQKGNFGDAYFLDGFIGGNSGSKGRAVRHCATQLSFSDSGNRSD
jgi:hypothetical protein